MRTLNCALRGAAVCGVLLVPPAVAQDLDASELNLHDGIWQVATEPVSGPCSKRYEFALSVDGGQISYAGMWPVDASGTVTAVGIIQMRLVHGDETVAARGVVRGEMASGKWASPEKSCAGSWVAHKT